MGYGQPEGGRDYNTTDISESRLRNLYLPPFKAAVDAGSDTVMCSFNSINGVPGCANHETETEILKKEWGFDGFIESDYTAVSELRTCPAKNPDEGPCGHGTAADGPEAGADALMAGTDSEMVSTHIRDNGVKLLAQKKITMKRLDDAVRRILRIKYRAGLFANPYVDQAKAKDPKSFVTAADRKAARTAAVRSMVLLKNAQTNAKGALPLDAKKKTVVIGPLGDNPHAMLGPWWGRGEDTDAVSVFKGLKAQSPSTTFSQGCTIEPLEPPANTPESECGSTAGFAAAVAAAKKADQVVLALGESREMSGEAATRSDIDLPGKQQELIDAIAATGKPFVVVLFNGRPLTLSKVAESSPAILEAWFPGIEAGNAVADVLFGKANPGGKLPVSFPQRLGQVPIYYNHEPTGRPCDATQKYTSRYRDLRTCDPLYAFGFGLSYTTFSVTNLSLDRTKVGPDGKVRASVTVTNTGATGRRRGRAALPARPGGQPVPARTPAARVRARHPGAGRVATRDVHGRQERLRLLRQRREVRRRARHDRAVRRRLLAGHPDEVVRGHRLTAASIRGGRPGDLLAMTLRPPMSHTTRPAVRHPGDGPTGKDVTRERRRRSWQQTSRPSATGCGRWPTGCSGRRTRPTTPCRRRGCGCRSHRRHRQPRRLADHRGRPGLPGHAAVAVEPARGRVRRVDDAAGRRPEPGHPEFEAELADSVGSAMLVVLQTLAPAERLAFVLHDMFAVPFERHRHDRSAAPPRPPASSRAGVDAGCSSPTHVTGDRRPGGRRRVPAASRSGDFERLLAAARPGCRRTLRRGGRADGLRGAARRRTREPHGGPTTGSPSHGARCRWSRSSAPPRTRRDAEVELLARRPPAGSRSSWVAVLGLSTVATTGARVARRPLPL